MDRSRNRKVSVACLLFRAGQRVRLGLDMWSSEIELETDANMDSIVVSLAQTHKDAKPLIMAARAMQAKPAWQPALVKRLTAIVASLGQLVIEPWENNPANHISLASQWKAANPLEAGSNDLDAWFDELHQSWIEEGRAICFDCLPPPVPTKEVSVFIASSSEGAGVAEAFRAALRVKKPDWKPIFWRDPGLFPPGKSTLEALEEIIGGCDFGIYVLTPDDKLNIRDQNVITPRGNVIFELGMGVGLHRRQRSLIVHDDVHRISDLSGINTLPYKAVPDPAKPVSAPSLAQRFGFGKPTVAPRIPASGECDRIAEEIIAAVKRETEATENLWRGR